MDRPARFLTVAAELAAQPVDVELTILMPCLNEAETLASCIDKAGGFLTRTGVCGEVLVADNGSTDGSVEIAQRHGARVVAVAMRGYGAALLAGIRAARGRFVIMGDADDSYDFAQLDPFLDKLREGYDLVIGNRFKGGIAPGAMPLLHRYIGNPVLSLIGRRFYTIGIHDFHCGLRGFSRDAILALGARSPGMEFASEMIVRASLGKLSMTEVPTTLSPDGRSRPPHLRTWRDGWRHLRFLLLFSPRWLFLYPGVAIVCIGLALSMSLLLSPISILPGVTLSTHSLIVACFAVVAGAQCLSFGIIARHHASLQGLLPPQPGLERWYRTWTLERLLIVAGFLLVIGLAGLGYSIGTWAAADFGELQFGVMIRILTLSCTAIVLGFQAGFTAFLGAIIRLGHQE
jgi:glycosyltransferase involved in cell wall biosynthesis